MDLRSRKRRSCFGQPYGASSQSLGPSSASKFSSDWSPSFKPDSLTPVPATLLPDYRVKMVCVGDGGCGKTSLLLRYVRGTFPEDYVPTIFENYSSFVLFDGKTIDLALWDTAGQEEYDRLRSLSYPETNVLIVCFAIDNIQSMSNVVERWLPEIDLYCPHVPFILVGLKSDLRTQTMAIEHGGMRQMASTLGAVAYVECSAKYGYNVERVFSLSLAAAISPGLVKQDCQVNQRSVSLPMANKTFTNLFDRMHREIVSQSADTALETPDLSTTTSRQSQTDEYNGTKKKDSNFHFRRRKRRLKQFLCTIS